MKPIREVMGQEIRLLLVARDDTVVDQVYQVCGDEPSLTLVGTVSRPDEAATVARQRRADVILLDESVLGDLETAVMEVSLAAPEQLVLVLLPAEDMEDIQRALLSGARGFVAKPFTAESFCNTITRVMAVEQVRRAEVHEAAADRSATGRVIAIAGAKGGVGRSILAANLAVALQLQNRNTSVLLVEGMSLPGDLPAILAVVPQVTLADFLVHTQQKDLDLAWLNEILPLHTSGIRVLPGVTDYLSYNLDPHAFRTFLRLMRRVFHFVIVDTGEILDPLTEVAITEADQLLLVTTPELPALYRTLKFMEALKEAGVDRSRVVLVLNGEGGHGGLRRERLEYLMGTHFQHSVRYDEETVMTSIHRGVPFVVSHKRTPIARDVKSLAEALTDGGGDGDHRSFSMAENLLGQLRQMFSGATLPVQEALQT